MKHDYDTEDFDPRRCEECGRLLARPSFYKPCQYRHEKPTLAQQIVEAIEHDLSDRLGFRHSWEEIDEDIRDGIRDEWAKLVEGLLPPAGQKKVTK